MTYASISQGFKSGGFNGRSTSEGSVGSFDPEFVTSYKIGVKSEWFGLRLRLNLAAFFNDYTDLQFTAISNDPATGALLVVVDNVATAEIKGFEIEARARPMEGLDLSVAAGYTDFGITKVDPSSRGVSVDTQQVRTPKWTANAGIQYTWPWQDYGIFRVRGDWAYEDKSFGDIQNTPELARDAYSINSVFFKIRCTVMCETDAAKLSSTALSASSLTVQRWYLFGVSEHG